MVIALSKAYPVVQEESIINVLNTSIYHTSKGLVGLSKKDWNDQQESTEYVDSETKDHNEISNRDIYLTRQIGQGMIINQEYNIPLMIKCLQLLTFENKVYDTKM